MNPEVSHELTTYLEIRKYLEASFDRGDELPLLPEIIHRLCRILDLSVPRKPGLALSEDDVRRYASRGWEASDGYARAALSIFFGWLEGASAGSIERIFGVVVDGVQ